uniref:Uncharacterized protein n=1 Tax=Candidozyma auris TaxID=498019 RepID=A0A0L0NWX1_CANAR
MRSKPRYHHRIGSSKSQILSSKSGRFPELLKYHQSAAKAVNLEKLLFIRKTCFLKFFENRFLIYSIRTQVIDKIEKEFEK